MMYKLMFLFVFSVSLAQAGGDVSNWVTDTSGSWFTAENWVEGVVPVDGTEVRFGVGDNDFSTDEIDINNAGLGVDLANSRVRFERKIIISDASADGNPLLADDGLVFDEMNINGAGGRGVVFNVPVTADLMTSNRHGGIFNREITVNTILARSAHQDEWEINAGATAPISYIEIDQNRGPDGGSISSFFAIRSDLEIDQLTHVWGELRVRAGMTVLVDEYLYFDYTNQAENNNINPINLAGELVVDRFRVFDAETAEMTFLAPGSYGSTDNQSTDFQVEFITNDGILSVVSGEFIFSDGFDQVDCAEPNSVLNLGVC